MLATPLTEVQPGRRLRLARLGTGPPLILLHGYPENLQVWCELAPLLAARFEVLAFDWPGLGYSDEWPGGASPVHLADRLLALVDGWGLERVTLAGLDMGAQPALVFAARHPERTRGVVAMNSLLFGDEATSLEIRILRRLGWNRRILRHLPRLVFARAEHTFLPPGVRLPAPLRRDFWEAFRRPPVRRFLAKMCAGYEGTLAELPAWYGRIRCPALAVWCGRDRHFGSSHGRRLAEAVAGASLEVIPGAEHWMAWHRAAEVAAAIGSWAARTG